MTRETGSTNKVESADRFPVVGVGASAGGLAALRAFFDGVPEKCGMAFVVIVHLDPNHKSHMAELLQRHTSMRVRQVSKATKIEPDQVYIIPPDKDLTLTDGHFRLSARAMPNRSRAPIDGFFRTLAETHTTDAIGIVLSGTGSDGTQGVGWIKEKGGITMAQIPHEAEYRSMPESAIATGHVDVILPVGQLGMETMRLCSGDTAEPATAGSTAAKREEAAIQDILALVRSKTQHDFTGYKRSTIDRRVRRRSQFARAASLPDYLKLLAGNADELATLYDDLLISVTGFFRDAEAFTTLERDIIPQLFANKKSSDTVRVWVTGCSTGEEAYSITILLTDHAAKLTEPPHIHVFATDVHERGFSIAREGVYPDTISSDVSADRLERFFTRETGGYRVKKVIRERVVFAVHNLLNDPPFLRIDLVSCRNLLIYLQRDAQRRVLRLFHFALRPGAHLFLGTSESVEDVAKLFTVVDKKQRIFRSINVPPQAPVTPLLDKSYPASAPSRNESGQMEEVLLFPAGHRRLLETFAPPSLVVNKEGNIVHLSEAVGKYLQVGSGKPTKKLVDMLPAPARPKVRKLLAGVISSGRRSELHGLSITASGRNRVVNLIARPLRGTNAAESFVMIVFDQTQSGPASVIASARSAGRVRTPSTILELERELADTKFQLGVTIEEHEASAEELTASNEELQSINEEHRATEEELEASKEELQSINEELQTINQEFRTKNEQLSELNSDLANLIDSTEIATLFLDRSLRVRRYTPAVTGVFNLLQSDAGRSLADVTHRLEYATLLDDAREAMRTLARLEREVHSLDGRWYVVRISPYRSLDDRIDGVVITFVDSTGRKLAEVDREHLLDEVQSASIAKSNFIGVMSHELRTPLNAILGYADILAAGAVGPISTEQARHLDRIKASAAHLAHMIDDSLQSVRIEAGITALDRQTVDIASIVREVALLTEPLMTAKKLAFEVNAEDGPPVFTDPTKVRQILFNLLGNAVRYTDAGKVTLSSKVTEHGATISIEDTGIGISTENMDKIFERFWQVDQSKTRLRGGTGLGLMVSRSLARLMGGELMVTSEFGKGSRFVVRLPLGDAEGVAAKD